MFNVSATPVIVNRGGGGGGRGGGVGGRGGRNGSNGRGGGSSRNRDNGGSVSTGGVFNPHMPRSRGGGSSGSNRGRWRDSQEEGGRSRARNANDAANDREAGKLITVERNTPSEIKRRWILQARGSKTVIYRGRDGRLATAEGVKASARVKAHQAVDKVHMQMQKVRVDNIEDNVFLKYKFFDGQRQIWHHRIEPQMRRSIDTDRFGKEMMNDIVNSMDGLNGNPFQIFPTFLNDMVNLVKQARDAAHGEWDQISPEAALGML